MRIISMQKVIRKKIMANSRSPIKHSLENGVVEVTLERRSMCL